MKFLFSVFFFIVFVSFLAATIINVPADQPTIQEGINVAVDGDTVLVQPGTYFENIDFIGKNITVASLFLTSQDTTYISQTIVDGDSCGSVVTFISGEDSTAVLCGFTITNGFADSGGGIFCYYSNPSLDNVTISGNTAHEGGGIMSSNSSLSLENVTISGNNSTAYHWDIFNMGGGIYCSHSDLNLINVTITGNTTGWGGGISCNASDLILVNVTITGNSAYENGGGIYCWHSSSLSFDSVDRCNIFLNFAGSGWDLYAYNCNTIDVIVDTFTVFQPDNYFAYPIDNFTFDILNAKIEQVDQDLYVSPDGSDDNSGMDVDDPLLTVSYALAKILADSTNSLIIHLSNGTYSPSQTGERIPLNCRSYVSLLGENEASTILDGEGLSRIFMCRNDNNFSIENITIQNGISFFQGGGIYCNNSSLSLENLIIIDNTAIADFLFITCGGGIYCNNSDLSLVNVTISGNTAEKGGGIMCEHDSNISLINVTISDNYAYYGGGMNCEYDSNSSLVNVTISDNYAYMYGGGISCMYYSSPSLFNVTITGNSTYWSGGGISCDNNSNPILVNCILWDNFPDEIDCSANITYSDIEGGWAGEGMYRCRYS
jgi:hypothetical protein